MTIFFTTKCSLNHNPVAVRSAFGGTKTASQFCRRQPSTATGVLIRKTYAFVLLVDFLAVVVLFAFLSLQSLAELLPQSLVASVLDFLVAFLVVSLDAFFSLAIKFTSINVKTFVLQL